GLLDKWKIDDKPVKTEKWEVSAVKNYLNDSAKMYKYVENFGLTDGCLTICTISCFFATVDLIWTQSPSLFWLCASYPILKDSTGMYPDDIWSILKRFGDKYTLKLTFISGRTNQQWEAEFTKFIVKILTTAEHCYGCIQA
ncbi:hypothetical protein E2I00_012330, partial [Balaenoptera physalus]